MGAREDLWHGIVERYVSSVGAPTVCMTVRKGRQERVMSEEM